MRWERYGRVGDANWSPLDGRWFVHRGAQSQSSRPVAGRRFTGGSSEPGSSWSTVRAGLTEIRGHHTSGPLALARPGQRSGHRVRPPLRTDPRRSCQDVGALRGNFRRGRCARRGSRHDDPSFRDCRRAVVSVWSRWFARGNDHRHPKRTLRSTTGQTLHREGTDFILVVPDDDSQNARFLSKFSLFFL